MNNSKKAKSEIWELEKIYWRKYKSGNSSISDIYHDEFCGWSPRSELAMNKAAALRLVEKNRSLKLDAANLKFVDATVIGDVGLVQFYRDGDRICHTWLCEDGQWRLLGGISCRAGKA